MGGPGRVLIAPVRRCVNSQYLPRAGGPDTAAGPGRLELPRFVSAEPKSRGTARGKAVAAFGFRAG